MVEPVIRDPKYTYSDTGIFVRNIAAMIDVVSPDDVPLLKAVGLNSVQKLLRGEVHNTKVEWIEDQLKATNAVLNEALDDNETDIDVATGEGERFFTGIIFRIDDELFWVVSVSNDTLTVATRPFGGTSAVTHDTSTVIQIVGHAQIEGAAPPAPRVFAFVQPYNHTQIFEDSIHMTGSQMAMKQYGLDDEYDYQVAKIFRELLIKLERSVIDGGRAAGSSTTARAMGGLRQYVTAGPADLSSAPLTQKNIEDTLQARFEAVGASYMPDFIIVNGWGKRKISSFYAPYVRTERSEKMGGIEISKVETDFGVLNIMLNRWVPTDRLYMVRMENIGVGPLRGREFFEERLAKTADAIDGHVVGEYTAIVKNTTGMARITGFSTSS
jgi:hypothetical protein